MSLLIGLLVNVLSSFLIKLFQAWLDSRVKNVAATAGREVDLPLQEIDLAAKRYEYLNRVKFNPLIRLVGIGKDPVELADKLFDRALSRFTGVPTYRFDPVSKSTAEAAKDLANQLTNGLKEEGK